MCRCRTCQVRLPWYGGLAMAACGAWRGTVACRRPARECPLLAPALQPSPMLRFSFLAHAVRFAMDRAGLVGADGATHCGAFDVTYMACLPNMVVMAPSNEAELINMVATCAAIDDRCA